MPRKPRLRLVKGDHKALKLPREDAKLFHEMTEAYQARRLGSLRHHPKSVSRDLSVIFDLVLFSGKAPWYWTEDDFDKWCLQIGLVRKLAVSSQRHYQSVIRTFLRYLIENVRFRNEVHRAYGVTLTQICHADNCIPHVVEREMRVERRALTHGEIDTLFTALDEAIAEAYRFGAKDYRPLQRDKVWLFTIYVGGLRISEARGLDMGSFRPNAAIPEFGDYGLISVWGKGSRGSGPRHRMVPVDHPTLPPLLQWYIDDVRPHFLRRADPNELALFLSERGRRMCISTMESRFQHALQLAGLDGQHLTPHSLRHSSITHGSMRMSAESQRIKAGHTYQSTTQGYMHVPDEFVRKEFDRATRKLLDRLKGKSEEDDDTKK